MLDLPEPVMAEIFDCCSLVVVLVPLVVSDVADFVSRLLFVMVWSCSSSNVILPRRAASFFAELFNFVVVDLPPTDLLI